MYNMHTNNVCVWVGGATGGWFKKQNVCFTLKLIMGKHKWD